MLNTPDTLFWYVIHTKSREEQRANLNLLRAGLETFLPLFKRQKARSRKCFTEAVFPGYLFARFQAARTLPLVRFTRGVKSVVSFGGYPVPIDDEILNAIRDRLAMEGPPSMPRAGATVRICDGPFESLLGVVVRPMPAAERVCVLLTAMTCHARLIIDHGLVDLVP